MVHDVFISYSTKDKITADAICHVLEENNIRCWIAPRNIVSGRSYAEEISDAISSTKIVVLVFSSNSQKSQFVNNEVNIAFSNNKPILSFKIDESMPEKDFEYYLKSNHWLDAYPEPEKVFATLVKDASGLVGDEKTNPIVDSKVMEKARNGELNQFSIKNEWKSFILMFTPLYPIGLIYMGIISKMRKMAIEGIICLIPIFMFILLYTSGGFGLFYLPQLEIVTIFIIVLWIISLVYVFLIRKDFVLRKSVINGVGDDDELFNALIEEYGRV